MVVNLKYCLGPAKNPQGVTPSAPTPDSAEESKQLSTTNCKKKLKFDSKALFPASHEKSIFDALL